MPGFDFLAETGEPLAIEAANSAVLDSAPGLAVEISLDPAESRELDSALAYFEALGLCVGDAVVASALEAREAWLFAPFYPVEEGVKGQRDAMHHVLKNLCIHLREFGVRLSPRGQIRLLGVSVHGDARRPILELPVQEQTVVDEAAGSQYLAQLMGLRLSGIKPYLYTATVHWYTIPGIR